MAETRMPELDPAQMSPEQKAMYDAIMSGPRRSIEGPFNMWLRSPDLGNRLQRVGEYLRFGSSVPPKLNELAILITAAEWKAEFEWHMHVGLATKAGLDAAIIANLREGRRPSDMSPDEALVYDFSIELLRDKRVSDASYDAAIKGLGERGVTDLLAVLGYYNLVSMTLNVAQVTTDAEPNWPEVR